MRPLAIALMILIGAAYSKMEVIETLNNDESHIEGVTTVEKRETDNESTESFNSFLEEKLTQQSQALEHLVKSVDKSGDLMKKLIENLSRGIEKPKLPAKAEAEVPAKHNRRSAREDTDHHIVSLGKNIPKYGRLAKHLILRQINSGTDPTPLIEKDPDLPTLLELGTRRSFGSNAVQIPSQQNDANKVNPWCPLALLCQKSVDPVCGFDDEFGYGKFEDLCHMLSVNCYWKYNFSVVLSCQPKL